MNLVYRNFKGVLPRLDRHLLNEGYAERAVDVNLWHGTLRPFREKVLCHEIKKTTKSLFYDNCCWKEFDKCVEFTRLNSTCSRQVVTGLFDYPASSCSDDCDPTWTRLGLPMPNSVLTVEMLDPLNQYQCYSENLIDSIDYARVSRTYVYTYVNDCCDESMPSVPTEDIDVDDGKRVMLSGFSVPPKEYNVTAIRIYRLASGYDRNNSDIEAFIVDEKNALSDFFLVDEIPIGQTTYIDSKMDFELGHALETRDFTPPPADLRGIITVNGTQLAGFYGGDKVRFSTPRYPHAWQEADELTFPDTIQALVPYGENVIVLTCGAVYTIAPIKDCGTAGCREVVKTLEDYPLVSCCGGTHGYTITPKGVVFVSIDGLILTDGKTAQNITSPYFAVDDWRALHPDRMSVAYYRDSIYFFGDNSGYCLQFPVSLSQWDNSILVEISDRPRWVFGENKSVFFVEDDAVYRWDSGDSFRPYSWKGKKEISPTQVNFAGAKVSRYNLGQCNFKLFGDDLLIKEYAPTHTEKFRLPTGRRDVEFQLELSGTAEVYSVELSTSYRELGTI